MTSKSTSLSGVGLPYAYEPNKMIFSGLSSATIRLMAWGKVFETGGKPVGWTLVLIGNVMVSFYNNFRSASCGKFGIFGQLFSREASMNFVFLSPHFPPNYYRFAVALKNHGVTVLGLADESYDSLRAELKSSMAEYFRVNSMHNYDDLLRALGYFTHRYGKLDRIDSHNEYWLETEARLRTDFNMPGIRTDQIGRIKRKSLMRETFRNAGVKIARGGVIHTLDEAQKLVEQTGYPLVAKPDIGVGAAATYKIHDEDELKAFFESKPTVDYLFEEFVNGQIVTFDGLTDRDGRP